MARVRSPGYPSYSLEDAIENVSKVFDEDRTNPVDREVVAKHLGYSGLNGAADKALATLMQYRLLEKVARGEVRVSQLAVDIMHPDKPEQKRLALIECAYAPALFDALRARFSEGVPSQSALKSYLLRERYNDRAIGPIMTAYTKTCALLERENATEGGEIAASEAAEGEVPEENDVQYGGAEVRDFVQREPHGALQLPKPLPREPDRPSGAKEWFRARVGAGKQVIILYEGEDDIDAQGLGKLIKVLEAQKLALED